MDGEEPGDCHEEPGSAEERRAIEAYLQEIDMGEVCPPEDFIDEFRAP